MSTCTFAGDADLYGLGVRLSLYLTGFGCILARIIAPSRTTGLATSLQILLFSITVSLIKNILHNSRTPAMLELYIVFVTTHTVTFLMEMAGGGGEGVIGRVATILVGFMQLAVVMWVSFERRNQGTGSATQCDVLVRFFAVVDVTEGLGIAVGVYAAVAMGYYLVVMGLALAPFALVWREWKEIRDGEWKITGTGEWLQNVVEMLDEDKGYQEIPSIHKLTAKEWWKLGVMVVVFGLGVWFTEDTVRLSNVNIQDGFTETGQLLPLVVGVVSLLSVFMGWIDDRMLNAVGRRIDKARKKDNIELQAIP